MILTLILVAFVLVAFEVVLPGGILGVVAALCVIAASILAHLEYGIWSGIGTFVGSCVLIALLVLIEFKLLAKTTLGQAFFLKESVTGHTGPTSEQSLAGKEGHTLTRLNPSGTVVVDGTSYEASSQDGYLDAETPIKVVAQNNFKLIIKKL